MPSANQLIIKLSKIINRQANLQIQNCYSQLKSSTAISLYLCAISNDKNLASGGYQEALTSTRLAYAIPRFKILAEDSTLAAADNSARQQLGLPLLACLYWQETPSLQIKYPLPLRSKAYLKWWQTTAPVHFRRTEKDLETAKCEAQQHSNFCDKKFGVNLIGHAFNIFGLGEYLRMMAKALDAGGIPYGVVNIPIGNGSSDQDRTLESKLLPADQPAPYAFNIFCMTADMHLIQALYRGLTAQHYSIATWFWELEKWPDPLLTALDVADEYWPCTRLIEHALHGARSFRAEQGFQASGWPPIIRMPPVMDLGPTCHLNDLSSNRHETRKAYGLNQQAVLFNFVFDLNSTISRKNPQAVLKTFQQAFADPASDVGLVIKTFPPKRPEPLWEELKATAARDPRITIIEADLDRPSILALLACCDVYVSLHRSEGLGIGLAEALQLGLDVIATNYGGNTDFCTGPLAHPIPYQLIPVPAGDYPHHQGMQWAEPDLNAAVEVMQAVAYKRSLSPTADQTTVDSYRQRFSAQKVGAHYRGRLEQLWQARHQIQETINGANQLSQP
jgi:glycosyltransferase involved in cell wall biosynthesis